MASLPIPPRIDGPERTSWPVPDLASVLATHTVTTNVRQRINLSWLVKLRWGAAIGQALAVLAVNWLLHIPLPLAPILGVVGITVTSNIAVTRWAARAVRVREGLVGAVVALDIILLTVLLYFTGGPTNPFNFLYLVHIALTAVIIRTRWMWALVGLACLCFASLFIHHVPLAMASLTDPTHPGLSTRLHQQGMGVAFALAASFIVYFVHRITAALEQGEQAVARARDLAARNERLTSLATLAAGAAHELATPLATIAVVAKELERTLAKEPQPNAGDDARLIRQEVERCRNVLTHMAADAGTSTGESFVELSVAVLLEQSLADLAARDRVQLSIDAGAAVTQVRLPQRSVSQAVRGVIKNALEASAPPMPGPGTSRIQQVSVHVSVVGDECRIRVTDAGCGMSPEVLAHVSEPFFTTKGPGAGMGLGLFLTRTLLERLGGALALDSVAGRGTTVVLTLPTVRAGS